MQECYQSLLSITATYSEAHRACAKISQLPLFRARCAKMGRSGRINFEESHSSRIKFYKCINYR